jgi:hypothetical protein
MEFEVVEKRGAIKIVQKIINGVPERRVLPADCDDFDFGPAYGVPWVELIEDKLPERKDMARLIAANLRKRGIWTREDFRNNPQAALVAIQDAYGVSMGVLGRIVNKQEA